MRTKNISLDSQTRRAAQAAFTRTELLILVLVASLLVAVRFSAYGGLKNQTKMAQCASNLRQLSLAMMLYGSENNGNLPRQNTGNWLWDMDWRLGNTLNQLGAPQESMYCPGTSPRFQPANNEDLYEYYAPGTFHVIGYAPTYPGSPSLNATNVNVTIDPQPIRSGTNFMPAPLASQRVLIADATILGSSGSYVFIPGGYPKAAHISPHLNGYLPAGGNLGMLDGHVEWRNFNLMQKRTDSTTPGSRPAFFW